MLNTKEWHTMQSDKAKWGEGPWMKEPDKKQWEDPETKLPCLIVRSHMGSLCGYVGVFPGHPFHEVKYSDDVVYPEGKVDVHGGLTYSGFCQKEEDEGKGICHVTTDEREVWWLGFDCSHDFDMMPKMLEYARDMGKGTFMAFREMDVYRDFDYVTREVTSLAKQLHKIGESGDVPIRKIELEG